MTQLTPVVVRPRTRFGINKAWRLLTGRRLAHRMRLRVSGKMFHSRSRSVPTARSWRLPPHSLYPGGACALKNI